MRSQAIRYLILPGWQGSPADHWQSHWERVLPNASRVEQADWDQPDRAAWVTALEHAIDAERTPVILIAHSLGCVTVAHWAGQADSDVLRRVRGALLVAPADVERAGCPEPLTGFAPIPRAMLPFPSLLVGSDNDHAASPQRALAMASDWGSEAVILAGAGHINLKSGHRTWESGFVHLYRLQGLVEESARRRA
ncbi:RBBP9/YdeN family alpha/beta hydrolase [Metapseudomonas furukawaii]|uniref:RBBP9/YdeN family alpha/beta hydrolase n=1 Tax=Metapseudomonas furukawaii TaxID=1149133 RepID=UPI0040454BAD